ncbi:conserved hypothetical protein (plasmid) [Rhodococcus jostii RHA1]|uniref:Amidase domain-containing protein n=2 Tax=Rhodococcus TaxID=1827 RepID=Q0RZE5_RHOJR|nr:conserved hypothetical protein [Rhodococcus jostii RHA1]EID74425.1 hypothetical protein W59_29979 [Rhodococcus opacus RKJ300 = JCM 13270]QQZ18573.1 hypothetical protein GO592_41265 [Rhodococcus sp. 21391]
MSPATDSPEPRLTSDPTPPHHSPPADSAGGAPARPRIDQIDPAINAIVTVQPEHALELARKAYVRTMSGEPLGPLHGLPIAHKDTLDTAGLRTTHGSPIFADHIPPAANSWSNAPTPPAQSRTNTASSTGTCSRSPPREEPCTPRRGSLASDPACCSSRSTTAT